MEEFLKKLFELGMEETAKDIAEIRKLSFEVEQAFNKLRENTNRDNAQAYAFVTGRFAAASFSFNSDTLTMLEAVADRVIVNERNQSAN